MDVINDGNMNTKRINKYDTIRLVLIFLVIVGHEMELFLTGGVENLYKIIYSFHMPAFMYITGKFARFDKVKVLKRFILPYVVFQILYIGYSNLALGETNAVQFTTPYWIMWYILVMIFCYVLLLFLPAKGTEYAVPVVLVSFALSIVVGYDMTVGYYCSLSRCIVFLPFFLWGYYSDSLHLFDKWKNKQLSMYVILALIIILGELYIIKCDVPIQLLYGSKAYATCGSHAVARFATLVAAAAWIEMLDITVPDIPVTLVSKFGTDTMPIYLLHGFVIKLLNRYAVFRFSQGVNILLSCLIAIAVIFTFGNTVFVRMYNKVFGYK